LQLNYEIALLWLLARWRVPRLIDEGGNAGGL